MSKYKLKLIDVDTNSKKGGSIRVIFSKNQKSKKNKQKIDKVINYEKRLKINSSTCMFITEEKKKFYFIY